MSAVTLTNSQEELVRKAALECGFKEFDITSNVGSIKGDNYLGVIHLVTVKEKNEEKVLDLILKGAHTNEVFRQKVQITAMFKREAYLYKTLISELRKLQEEKAISQPFTGVAKFYGCCLEDKNESILMQNLKKCGYDLWDRMKPMDDEHVRLVFAEYARLHAMSLAFKRLRPEEFAQLTKEVEKNVFAVGDPNKRKEARRVFIDVNFKSGLSLVRGNPKATAALEKLRGNIEQFFENVETLGKDKFVVMHGDCWCNNMLFKYEDNQKSPSKVCFIDWQLSSLGSPIFDLTYFFSVCGSKPLFPNLDNYLSLYHQVLSKNLEEFGCDPDEVLSFQELKDEWKKNAWYGVYIAMMLIKLMLSESEEVPNISDAKAEGTDLMDSLANFKHSKSEEVETRFCDLVEFMTDNNYV